VVVVGAATTVYLPLNVESTPSTHISSPATSPCTADVVRVATLDVNALLVIVPTLIAVVAKTSLFVSPANAQVTVLYPDVPLTYKSLA
jgi:hypothetical protein